MDNAYFTDGDLRIPKLGMGTWQLEGDECQAAVETALEIGYRHLDTAQMYGNERRVGDALRASAVAADDVWVTTKVGNDNHGRDDLLASAERSLDALGLERVDLLLIHWPLDGDSRAEALQALDEAQQVGLTRFVGVSNFTPEQVREARRHADIANVQVEHHPYLAQGALLGLSEAAGFCVTAYSPLARGEVGGDETLRSIAMDHGATPEQVALAWLLAKDRVIAIPKASSRQHLEANAAALTVELTADERARIDALDEGRRLIDPDFAPEWESASAA